MKFRRGPDSVSGRGRDVWRNKFAVRKLDGNPPRWTLRSTAPLLMQGPPARNGNGDVPERDGCRDSVRKFC